MNICIIDDEKNCRLVLRDKIKTHIKDAKIIGEADGVKKGVNMIMELKPDLIFLDIKMRDGSGFDLLNQLDSINFKLIFTTAFDNYAIKAFKYSALDYLLKPVDYKELCEAYNRAQKQIVDRQLNKQFLNTYESGKFETLCLRTEDDFNEVNINDIETIKAEGSYCIFELTNKKKIMISKPLKEYVQILPIPTFIRTHKSYLINADMVETFNYKSSELVLKSKKTIPVSRRNKANTLEIMLKMKHIKIKKTR